MAAAIEAIEAEIREAIEPEFRGRLLARGQARSMIWQDGELPEGAPDFSPLLSYDLLSYGYAMLSYGLRLLEREGDRELARTAFEHAAGAIESVIHKGEDDETSDFHRVVTAAAYHLGRYSARAYSMLHANFVEANLSPPEQCLGRLMLRDLDTLNEQIETWRLEGRGSDAALTEALSPVFASDIQDGDTGEDDAQPFDELVGVLDLALVDNFMAGLGTAMLAFERGERQLLDDALDRLHVGLEGAQDLNLVPQWWCHRLTIHLLDDLWECSFHRRLPQDPTGPVAEAASGDWIELRRLFIASLLKRARAEVELWPSQIDAAMRAQDPADNMVVSLPTSAGKTRIAELCILACLASGKRVVFMTPLRALSAQTEVGLQRTFGPLGKSVSSLYGSIGVSAVDEDILRDRDIIVATPEKLDFALRNDPGLLNDVGLVVMDEGHMIGIGEREVRYEVQIQRLLRRSDAGARRIVCLSAVLPGGSELEDFVAWLTNDSEDGLHQKKWRPTKLRFGDVDWHGNRARLNIRVGDEKSFVPQFFAGQVPPIGRRRAKFPRNQRELCLATAWRLARDGQSVLIFCPLRKSVEPFAKAIVDLHKRGALASVLETDEAELATALAIGTEWFGADHAILKCLKMGVAVHHGALPTPYRKEVERLLRANVLTITVSSPTLAQGLNLSATSLVFHGVFRNGKPIETSEFRNVVGRAGRAFVDLEGLVLYPMFNGHAKRREDWENLIDDEAGREMESGLLRLLVTLLQRMWKKIGNDDLDRLIEYIVNNADVWSFPSLANENPEVTVSEELNWSRYMASLDTAILSLLGEQDIADDDVEVKIDEILTSSLFKRRLARQKSKIQNVLRTGLVERARHIWSASTPIQRRGYFLAGVGFSTGQELDANAKVLGELLVQAEVAVSNDLHEEAIEAITGFAGIVFQIQPFVPDDMLENWKTILASWLKGETIVSLAAGNQDKVLHFIEQGLVYKLPWAMEAVRVRGLAHDDKIGEFSLSDFELGIAVAAVETGSLNLSAVVLMQSGFNSRLAAIKAVTETEATFSSARELRQWLKSGAIATLIDDPSWPTLETHKLWVEFVMSLVSTSDVVWKSTKQIADVKWVEGTPPTSGTALRIGESAEGKTLVFSPNYEVFGTSKINLNPNRKGLLLATSSGSGTLELEYLGPNDLAMPES